MYGVYNRLGKLVIVDPEHMRNDYADGFVKDNGDTIPAYKVGNVLLSTFLLTASNGTKFTLAGQPVTVYIITNDINARNIPVTNACFVKGTPVLTDQGIIAIDHIVPSVHTIRGMKIVDVLRTRLKDNALYRFEKDALYKNVPNQATTMSPNHCVFYNGKMRRAKEFLNNVTKIEYKGEILYNVLLETHDKMIVNNMIVETLCPLITSYSKTVPDLPLTLWRRNRKPFRSLPF